MINTFRNPVRRSPHGGRGLKFICWFAGWIGVCRSPHGGRGLKLLVQALNQQPAESLSSRRAWIEMTLAGFPLSRYTVALLTEGVD